MFGENGENGETVPPCYRVEIYALNYGSGSSPVTAVVVTGEPGVGGRSVFRNELSFFACSAIHVRDYTAFVCSKSSHTCSHYLAQSFRLSNDKHRLAREASAYRCPCVKLYNVRFTKLLELEKRS